MRIIKKIWSYFKTTKHKKPAILIDKKIKFHSKNNINYVLVFELFTKEKLTFNVLPSTYSLFFIGDKGILIYKGKQFIYFNKKY